MKTIVILLGNSDDKLPQREWACFVNNVLTFINSCTRGGDLVIHFSGAPAGHMPHQNYCIVFECHQGMIGVIKEQMVCYRKNYNQDSIAWIDGVTEFI